MNQIVLMSVNYLLIYSVLFGKSVNFSGAKPSHQKLKGVELNHFSHST